VYGRDYAGKTLRFEASGGLLNSSLVMQDKETDTYWSIMTGSAIGGELEGTELEELPVFEKVQWKDWVEEHPDTLVLSVRGTEDPMVNPYDGYFTGERGYRGATAEDDRLPTMEPIYAFMRGERPYAVAHVELAGGRTFELDDDTHVLLYRGQDDELFRGTAAYRSTAGFRQEDGTWIEAGTGSRFDTGSREFSGGSVERLGGIDTFWYTWSLTHDDTELLTAPEQ